MRVSKIAILVALIYSVSANAADWSSCESELSRVNRQARDAESVASDLDSLKGELDMLKDDYESCLQFPDVFDLMQDGCLSKRDEYNWKVDEYNSRLSDMSSEMDSLIRRVKDSLSYCGYE